MVSELKCSGGNGLIDDGERAVRDGEKLPSTFDLYHNKNIYEKSNVDIRARIT